MIYHSHQIQFCFQFFTESGLFYIIYWPKHLEMSPTAQSLDVTNPKQIVTWKYLHGPKFLRTTAFLFLQVFGLDANCMFHLSLTCSLCEMSLYAHQVSEYLCRLYYTWGTNKAIHQHVFRCDALDISH
jgi:hypothetical protein